MSKIPSEIELARIRQKLKEDLGRDLTAEECRLLGLSKLVIKAEPEQKKTGAAAGQSAPQSKRDR